LSFAASDFVAVSLSVKETDPGRLKPRYRTSADGGCWFLDWWDSELETACDFMTNSNGQSLCIPSGTAASPSEFFTDDGCTQSVSYMSTVCNPEAFGNYVRVYDQASCTFSASVRPIVATIPAASLPARWVGFPANCQPFSPDPEATYFELGPIMDAAMFMGGTVGVE